MKLGKINIADLEIITEFYPIYSMVASLGFTPKSGLSREIINRFIEKEKFRDLFDYTTEEKNSIILSCESDYLNKNKIVDKIMSGMQFTENELRKWNKEINKKADAEWWERKNSTSYLDETRTSGDWSINIDEVMVEENSIIFIVTNELAEEFSVTFQNHDFSHSYNAEGDMSEINDENFPLLINDCRKWSIEVLRLLRNKL